MNILGNVNHESFSVWDYRESLSDVFCFSVGPGWKCGVNKHYSWSVLFPGYTQICLLVFQMGKVAIAALTLRNNHIIVLYGFPIKCTVSVAFL